MKTIKSQTRSDSSHPQDRPPCNRMRGQRANCDGSIRKTPAVVKPWRKCPKTTAVRFLRSPISYPGSKAKLANTLIESMPLDWTEFREPFAGGASISLALMQRFPDRKFWINDLDPYVSGFWTTLQRQPESLCGTLTNYLQNFPTDQDKRCLFDWARTFVHESEGVEQASLYYFLAKTAFAGLAHAGGFYDPKSFNPDGIAQLSSVGQLIRSVDLRVTNLDYGECLAEESKVFTYFDPPYLIGSMLYGMNGNMHRTFDHRRFASKVTSVPSKWMVSYNDDLLIRHYFRRSRVSTIPASYVIGMKRKASEVVITNYEH